MKLIVCAFAISNNYGSEESVAFRYLSELHDSELMDRYEQIIVFTCNEISMQNLVLFFPKFYFHRVSLGRNIKEIYYNQGNWLFYAYYLFFSLGVLRRSLQHLPFHSWHLNLVGYREPGLLFLIADKHVWGPVSGVAPLNLAFIRRGRAKEAIKISLNFIQQHFSVRVWLACRLSSAIFFVTKEDGKYFSNRSRAPQILEQICEVAPSEITQVNLASNRIKVIWVGKDLPRKCLWLALEVARRTPDIEFSIVGVESYPGVELSNVTFHGRVPWGLMQKLYSQSNVLLVTSVQEATSTVVTEAIESGLYIVAHDIGGISAVTSEQTSSLITLDSPKHSIETMARILKELRVDEIKAGYERYYNEKFGEVVLAKQFSKISHALLN